MTSNRVGTGVLTENAEEEEVTEEERVRTERLNPFSFSSASVTLCALCENSGARSGIMNGGLASRSCESSCCWDSWWRRW